MLLQGRVICAPYFVASRAGTFSVRLHQIPNNEGRLEGCFTPTEYASIYIDICSSISWNSALSRLQAAPLVPCRIHFPASPCVTRLIC